MIGNILITLAMTSLSWGAEISHASDGHVQNPVWSPDGKKLAFEVNNNSGRIELFAVKMSGIQHESIKKIEVRIANEFGSTGSVNVAPLWFVDEASTMLIFEHSHKGSRNRRRN